MGAGATSGHFRSTFWGPPDRCCPTLWWTLGTQLSGSLTAHPTPSQLQFENPTTNVFLAARLGALASHLGALGVHMLVAHLSAMAAHLNALAVHLGT